MIDSDPRPAPPATAGAFSVTALVLEYREAGRVDRPLDGISFDIPRSRFVCVLGPSGHGKSTLLRCLAGLLAPTSGGITADGEPVTGPGADRGMVFQGDAVPLWLRVEDNVAFGPRARGVPRSRYGPRVESLIEEVGLAGHRRAWPRQLSGGLWEAVAPVRHAAHGTANLLRMLPILALGPSSRSDSGRTRREASSSSPSRWRCRC